MLRCSTALKLSMYIIRCNVALTTKAATSVLKCKRKPTRQSLSPESCQRLRLPPIHRTPAVFSAAGVYSLSPAPEWCLCVGAVPHWGIKWQAGSIKTDLIVRWRDSAECLWMCWRSARATRVLGNTSQGMKGAPVTAEEFTQSSPKGASPHQMLVSQHGMTFCIRQ